MNIILKKEQKNSQKGKLTHKKAFGEQPLILFLIQIQLECNFKFLKVCRNAAADKIASKCPIFIFHHHV